MVHSGMRSLMRPFALVLLVTLGAGSASAETAPNPKPRPYGRGKATLHRTLAPPYHITNEAISLAFDFETGTIQATTIIDVQPKDPSRATLPFDSVGLTYNFVAVNGTGVRYTTDAEHLYVTLPTPVDTTKPLQITTQYVGKPTRGIYFVRPNAAYPKRQAQIWTQGEEEDNRRWFPTWDEPNEKFTTTLSALVPADWTVISNGTLENTIKSPDEKLMTYIWREARPHSAYLTSFVAGPYVKTHDILGSLDVDYYTSAEDAPLAKQCFGRTPEMIAFFEDVTKTAYPWEKYAQTTVSEFTAGGMENVSATTQTQFAIHPPEYELTNSCDSLVSHELAHQWFGDDVTTVDWPHIWINEGFATYFQELWSEHHFGKDRFDYERKHAQDAYFGETKRYWRPIVEFTYGSAHDTFDASGYSRPAQVLDMLRYVLGDQAFFKAIHDYLAERQFTNVDTRQFEASVEQSSKTDLKWFFDEWFYQPSYPAITVTQKYEVAAKRLRLDIRQSNHAGVLFRMPAVIEAYDRNGAVLDRRSFSFDRANQSLTIENVREKPALVLFDPGQRILRKLTINKTIDELAFQVTKAANVADRLWALERLGERSGAERPAARAAARSAQHDAFYGVRVDALDALGALDDAEGIRTALSDADPRVKIAAAEAVAKLKVKPANLGETLVSLTEDANGMVAGAALRGLGSFGGDAAYPRLIAALDQPSRLDARAIGALSGLGELGDTRAIDVVRTRTAYGQPERLRTAAIAALGKLGKKNPALVVPTLLALAQNDPYFRARSSAVAALGKLGQRSTLEPLAKIRSSDSEVGVSNAADDAISDIHDTLAAKPTPRPAP